MSCISFVYNMCDSYLRYIGFTYYLHILFIWFAYNHMLIAFDIHMIHIRSTYDLHTIYIDYCYDLHGLPARLTPTCLAGPPHARGEGRKNLNCDRLPLYIRPTGAAIRLRHLNSESSPTSTIPVPEPSIGGSRRSEPLWRRVWGAEPPTP